MKGCQFKNCLDAVQDLLTCFDITWHFVCVCVLYCLCAWSETWIGKAKQCCIAALPVGDRPPYGTACHGLRKIYQTLNSNFFNFHSPSSILAFHVFFINILHVISLFFWCHRWVLMTSHENFGTLPMANRFLTQLGSQTELVRKIWNESYLAETAVVQCW